MNFFTKCDVCGTSATLHVDSVSEQLEGVLHVTLLHDNTTISPCECGWVDNHDLFDEQWQRNRTDTDQ